MFTTITTRGVDFRFYTAAWLIAQYNEFAVDILPGYTGVR